MPRKSVQTAKSETQCLHVVKELVVLTSKMSTYGIYILSICHGVGKRLVFNAALSEC